MTGVTGQQRGCVEVELLQCAHTWWTTLLWVKVSFLPHTEIWKLEELNSTNTLLILIIVLREDGGRKLPLGMELEADESAPEAVACLALGDGDGGGGEILIAQITSQMEFRESVR